MHREFLSLSGEKLAGISIKILQKVYLEDLRHVDLQEAQGGGDVV